MTEDGLTEYRVEVVGTSLEKKLYSITPKGREEFMRWICENTSGLISHAGAPYAPIPANRS